MGLEAFIAIAIILFVVATLACTRISADAMMVFGLLLLMLLPVPDAATGGWRLGILTPGQAFAGFGNTGLITVGILFVVVCGLRQTGGIDWIAEHVLGKPRNLRAALTRMIFPVAGISAFLNNTPVVAMLIPAVEDWSKKIHVSSSKLMIPLSYAAILGGTCSLIGTSTNLVVAGLILTHTDMEPLGMFDITRVGLPVALIGGAFLVFVGPWLLRDRRSATSVMADPREYTLEMMLPERSPMEGKTVEQAGLRNLPGGYLVQIARNEEMIMAVGPDQILHAGDRLIFVGVVDSIKELQNLRGLMPATDQMFKLDSPRYRRRLYEAVLSRSCPIIGKTIREGRFRNRYNAAVIAVARSGERVAGKLGDIKLQIGDVLLLEADRTFEERFRESSDFLLVSALEDSAPRRHTHAPIALGILVAMVAVVSLEWLPMTVGALLAAAAMLATRCCTLEEARRSIDWSVLIVIGAALGLGQALDKSGAASGLAGGIVGLAGERPWLLLLAVYAITSFLTEIITNNAAVALSFPIAWATTQALDINFMPFAIAIMMAGSASFATPLGYQTNLMVYGPGGYNFRDFMRIGIPMNLLVGLITVLLTPLFFKF